MPWKGARVPWLYPKYFTVKFPDLNNTYDLKQFLPTAVYSYLIGCVKLIILAILCIVILVWADWRRHL